MDHPNEHKANSGAERSSQVVYDGYITFENGSHVDGPRQKATICIDNNTKTITVSMNKPTSVFVAPGKYLLTSCTSELRKPHQTSYNMRPTSSKALV